MTKPPNYSADGIGTRLSTYPHTKPIMNEDALVEACRAQVCTWATARFGLSIPARLSGTETLMDVLLNISDVAEEHLGDATDDVTVRGLWHLLNAFISANRAHFDYGDIHLLSALRFLINADAALSRGLADTAAMERLEHRTAVIDEQALIETVRLQLNSWGPAALKMDRYESGAITSAPSLSDAIADVIDKAQAKYGHMQNIDHVRGMAHLANAYAHSLKAGYNHGNAYVLAALNSLILAAGSLSPAGLKPADEDS